MCRLPYFVVDLVVVVLLMKMTAYEMRISDWSSDVCSSDLVSPRRPHRRPRGVVVQPAGIEHRAAAPTEPRGPGSGILCRQGRRGPLAHHRLVLTAAPHLQGVPMALDPQLLEILACPAAKRSEEHTSELQSLMRHSYAVFCLKKK